MTELLIMTTNNVKTFNQLNLFHSWKDWFIFSFYLFKTSAIYDWDTVTISIWLAQTWCLRLPPLQSLSQVTITFLEPRSQVQGLSLFLVNNYLSWDPEFILGGIKVFIFYHLIFEITLRVTLRTQTNENLLCFVLKG